MAKSENELAAEVLLHDLSESSKRELWTVVETEIGRRVALAPVSAVDSVERERGIGRWVRSFVRQRAAEILSGNLTLEQLASQLEVGRIAIKIDATLMDEVGLGALPANEADPLLRAIRKHLELEVGQTIGDRLSIGQLDEFQTYYDAKDTDAARAFLVRTAPNYKDMVAEFYVVICAQLADSASAILIELGMEGSAE